MAEYAALSIAFIERRSAAAARALASMNPGDAAAFLETVPARTASRAFLGMNAWAAASILARMQALDAAAALRDLRYQHATAVLRLMDLGARAAILDAVPSRMKRDLETSLSFPADTVGAHMTTSVLTFDLRHTVADAQTQMRRTTRSDIESVFIVDNAKHLAGVVRAGALLRQPPQAELADIMDRHVEAVPARARLATVADLAAWDLYNELPVVSRGRAVIGALGRRSLRRDALHGHEAAGSGMAVALVRAFAASLAGIAQLWLAASAAPPPSVPEEES